MTKEEAIRCLSVHSSTNGSGLCTDEQHYEAKQMAIKALEQTTWIPVSERLPEDSGNYLITYCLQDEIETQEAVYVKGEEEDKWFDITNIEITLAVTAWMPLPKCYEPQESEDGVCKDCDYNDGKAHAECVLCDKAESEE